MLASVSRLVLLSKVITGPCILSLLPVVPGPSAPGNSVLCSSAPGNSVLSPCFSTPRPGPWQRCSESAPSGQQAPATKYLEHL